VNYALRLRPELIDDTHEAFAWYEAAATGLGHELVRSFLAAAAAVQRNPLAYRKCYQEFRRVLLARFPYAVYFRVERRVVVIFLLVHGARDPSLVHSRLHERKRSPG
jgi:toxin ParE1/3/4